MYSCRSHDTLTPSTESINLFWDDQLNQRLYMIFLYFSNSLSPEEFDLVAIENEKNDKKHINVDEPFYKKHYHQIFQYTNVSLSPNTAYFLINRIFRLINPTKAENIEFPEEYNHDNIITFDVFIYLIRIFFHDRISLEPAVDKVYERFVIQIIFKGFVLCEKIKEKYSCIPINLFASNSKVYWCTILPGSIFLWELTKRPSPSKRHFINLTKNTDVPETSFFKKDRFEFTIKIHIHSSFTTYNFAHFDELCSKKIVESIRLAVECNNRDELTKFDMNHASLTECKKQKNKLMTWKTALEMENERLTKVLLEEKEKLRDEEIVRTMTTRMLFDEKDKVKLLKKELFELKKIIDSQNLYNGYQNNKHLSLKKKNKRFLKRRYKKKNCNPNNNNFSSSDSTSDMENELNEIILKVPCNEFSEDFSVTDAFRNIKIGPRVKESMASSLTSSYLSNCSY
uniref:FERM domain-containing protein n=1 Tax=Strongyloides stercoralis TaxID=6248 RepID=A0A0K0DUY9_STRER